MLEILYQDDTFIAINKPAGVLVHRSKVDPRADKIALQMLRNQIGRHVYPVHRLDKPTTGVLLFGLDAASARQLSSIFAARKLVKTYKALVRGYVDDDTIDYPLKEILDRKTDRKAQQDKPSQPAVTRYQQLAKVELPYPVGRYQTARYSLVELIPKTGRKHQLRRHMKHIFHPILGDRKYGDWRHNNFLESQFGCRQLLLHAASLSFEHPVSGQRLLIEADYPVVFRDVMEGMGFEME